MHIALLGDSIFDNGRYLDGGNDVATHLRSVMSAAQISLLAMDGSITAFVEPQLAQLPPSTSHLVISVGGNDALGNMGLLDQPTQSVGEALSQLAQVALTFESDYRAMLRPVLERGLPTVICTIYNPRFIDPVLQQTAAAGLALYNDTIIWCAVHYRLPFIDLRMTMTEPEDYANDIEPSEQGGAKIAAAIANAIEQHDFSHSGTRVYF